MDATGPACAAVYSAQPLSFPSAVSNRVRPWAPRRLECGSSPAGQAQGASNMASLGIPFRLPPLSQEEEEEEEEEASSAGAAGAAALDSVDGGDDDDPTVVGSSQSSSAGSPSSSAYTPTRVNSTRTRYYLCCCSELCVERTFFSLPMPFAVLGVAAAGCVLPRQIWVPVP